MSDGEADTDEAIEQAQDTVINAMTRTAEVYGAKQIYGRLYGILYFSPEPLSLDDLTDASGYAKSTVSTAMKTLQGYHLVERRSIPGEGKKAFYEAEDDFWYVFCRFLGDQVAREADIMLSSLEEAQELLEDGDSEDIRYQQEQVEKLTQTYEKAQQMIDLFTSGKSSSGIEFFKRFRSDDS